MTRAHWESLSHKEKNELAEHLDALLANVGKLHPDEEAFCQELLDLEKRVGNLRGAS